MTHPINFFNLHHPIKAYGSKIFKSLWLKRFPIWYRNIYHIYKSWNHPYCNTVILWLDPLPQNIVINCNTLAWPPSPYKWLRNTWMTPYFVSKCFKRISHDHLERNKRMSCNKCFAIFLWPSISEYQWHFVCIDGHLLALVSIGGYWWASEPMSVQPPAPTLVPGVLCNKSHLSEEWSELNFHIKQ